MRYIYIYIYREYIDISSCLNDWKEIHDCLATMIVIHCTDMEINSSHFQLLKPSSKNPTKIKKLIIIQPQKKLKPQTSP